MEKLIKIIVLLLISYSPSVFALQTSPGLNLSKGPSNPYYTYTRRYNIVHHFGHSHLHVYITQTKHYGSFKYNQPSQLHNSTGATFNLKDLIGTSINGMLDPACGGGYCITGICAHWYMTISLFHGIHWYTIISPKIRHAMPVLLISAYNGVGREPLKAWRDTVGASLAAFNTTVVGALLGTPDGLQMGNHGQEINESTTYKEVDIIGHPLALLPDLVNNGHVPSAGGYRLPNYSNMSNINPPAISQPAINLSPNANTVANLKQKMTNMVGNLKQKMNPANIATSVKKRLTVALSTLSAVKQAQAVMQNIQTIRNIKHRADQIIAGFQATSMAAIASSGWGLIGNTQFRAPRLFCSTAIKPFQPYYLTFADAFWWRSGYPITDGPISGSNKSSTIFNPLSTDTLPKTNSMNIKDLVTKEIWGHMYPREGAVMQPQDAEGASVLAWRGLDVLKTAVRDGHRVGVPLPTPISGDYSDVSNKTHGKITGGKWQMIFPQVKQCKDEPYYNDLKPSQHGDYAWNYYRTYECCSNTKGHFLFSLSLPKICIPAHTIQADNKKDKAAYQQWLQQKKP